MSYIPYLIYVLAIIAAYLIGSISSAILVCKLFRLPDPRTQGSGNPGATNVLRIGGKLPAFLTLVGDVAKGWLPVLLIKFYTANPYVISGVLFAALIGHLYPLYFSGKGGKGVATTLGGLFGLSPTLGAIFVFCWLGVFALCRYSSLSALVAITSIPFWAWGFLDKRYVIVLSVVAMIIIWKHQENIKNLWRGTEKKTTFIKKNVTPHPPS